MQSRSDDRLEPRRGSWEIAARIRKASGPAGWLDGSDYDASLCRPGARCTGTSRAEYGTCCASLFVLPLRERLRRMAVVERASQRGRRSGVLRQSRFLPGTQLNGATMTALRNSCHEQSLCICRVCPAKADGCHVCGICIRGLPSVRNCVRRTLHSPFGSGARLRSPVWQFRQVRIRQGLQLQ